MILGIASFALCLTFITGIPAIILGHISWSKVRRSMGQLKGEGMAMAGLIMGYLSIPWFLIFAAIAIPNFAKARISANEAVAMSTIRTFNTTQVTYETEYPARGYAPDLATLGPGPDNNCGAKGTAEHACLIDNVLGNQRCTSGVWCQKGAYKYTITANCKAHGSRAPQEQQDDEGDCKDYVVVATPVTVNDGRRSFCSVPDAVVRYHFGPPLAKAPTVQECQLWSPLTY